MTDKIDDIKLVNLSNESTAESDEIETENDTLDIDPVNAAAKWNEYDESEDAVKKSSAAAIGNDFDSSNNSVRKGGISLRTLYTWLIVLAIIISGLMVFSTFHLRSTFSELEGAMDEYIELEKSAKELMDASDYLTEKVQRFTIDGNVDYMDDYFNEAFNAKRREGAVKKLSEDPDNKEALEQLQEALNGSRALMNREYYAMRLVIEAKGYTEWPKVLDDVKLTAKDAALSAEDKMRRATEMVLGEEYYEEKDEIRQNMNESLHALEQRAHEQEDKTESNLVKEMNVVRFIILLQTLGIFMIIWLTSVLGIDPILRAVEKIKGDDPIPEVGANEFRYLASAYNKMYKVYKRSIEHLNYKASHDELTGVYNRAGYDLLVSSLDLSTTFMLFLDVDDFKKVNDTGGHESGDHILVKVAHTLKNYFRSDDYVCRMGGDEFVVFMVHSDEAQSDLIAAKIRDINEELQQTDDGLPPVSISVGIAHGRPGESGARLLERADEAMYMSKRRGKHQYTFYTDK